MINTEDRLDHFVLVIGYGTEDGVDFWLCQNFWGTDYREGGYFRIERNAPDPRGTAGIARRCYFPVIYGNGASSTFRNEGEFPKIFADSSFMEQLLDIGILQFEKDSVNLQCHSSLATTGCVDEELMQPEGVPNAA